MSCEYLKCDRCKQCKNNTYFYLNHDEYDNCKLCDTFCCKDCISYSYTEKRNYLNPEHEDYIQLNDYCSMGDYYKTKEEIEKQKKEHEEEEKEKEEEIYELNNKPDCIRYICNRCIYTLVEISKENGGDHLIKHMSKDADDYGIYKSCYGKCTDCNRTCHKINPRGSSDD